MSKHKPICIVVILLLFIGAVNWGLVGLGQLLKMNLNVVNLLFGAWPVVESIIYLVVGVAGLAYGYLMLTCQSCACQTVGKK